MTTNEGLQRRVLRDDVVEHIIDSILEGTLKPGDKIVETRISRELHVSQGAVREAIRDLTARGFVETEPYKGSRVKILSEDGLLDYLAVRRELESLAARWALEKEALDVDELYSIVSTMEKGVAERDMGSIMNSDLMFHRKIVECSGNDSLVRSWESLANDYWIYTITSRNLKDGNDLSRHPQDHLRIVDAIAKGDCELMKTYLQDHFPHKI